MFTNTLNQRLVLLTISVCAMIASLIIPATVHASGLQVTVNDPAISDIQVTLGSSTPGAMTTVQYTFTLTETVGIGEAITFHFAGGLRQEAFSSLQNFSSATYDLGSIDATVTNAPESSDVRLTANAPIAPGTYVIQMNNVMNSTQSACYGVAVTTFTGSTTTSQMTYTENGIKIGVDSCSENPIDVPLTTTVFGTLVHIDWNPATFQEYTTNTYSLVYGKTQAELSAKLQQLSEGDSSVASIRNITATDILLNGMDRNTTYYFAVVAYYNSNLVGFTQTGAQAKTSAKTYGQTRLSQPTIHKKSIKKHSVEVKWKAPVITPKSYVIEVRQKNGKKVREVSNLSSSKTKKTVIHLDKNIAYKFRVRGQYTVTNLMTGVVGTTYNQWSSYSNSMRTKK